MLLRKINSAAKDFLLATRIGLLIKPIKGQFKFVGNFSELTAWIQKHNSIKGIYNDFYSPRRVYSNREKLHAYLSEQNGLGHKEIQYYEFGVASGKSFRWWLGENKNPNSTFWGFDTFEGLPEDWHFYPKGAMSHQIPEINDTRASFIKGLFQNTFFEFLKTYPPKQGVTKVLHMDADLYSSTLFILTAFAPLLNEGDIIMFDEFNVPNHEFAAWNDFVRSYYVQYELIGAVNNYYQTAFKFKGIKASL